MWESVYSLILSLVNSTYQIPGAQYVFVEWLIQQCWINPFKHSIKHCYSLFVDCKFYNLKIFFALINVLLLDSSLFGINIVLFLFVSLH